ncbi:MAG: molybdenum cofactor guanylyltransferase [Deltaproteobacteria bacterium]|jgi:molybdopterin-guanine dinucleotide biosynthesis protein A|nr:molybdenum cofactor guanylyltransferase [Deltaproteobacteria bacterium]
MQKFEKLIPYPTNQLTGVVLAGGTSSRLGRDKAELILREDGAPLLVETARLLRRVVPKVVISGRPSNWIGHSRITALPEWPGMANDDFPGLPDDLPGKGPVGAITTALRHMGTACLILACDMPLMEERVLRLLLETWSRQRASANTGAENSTTKKSAAHKSTAQKNTLVTAFAHPENGKLEHLAAIYEPEALSYLEPSLNADLLKIGLVIPQEHYCLIPLPPDMREAFFNINRPADLEAVRRKLGEASLF